MKHHFDFTKLFRFSLDELPSISDFFEETLSEIVYRNSGIMFLKRHLTKFLLYYMNYRLLTRLCPQVQGMKGVEPRNMSHRRKVVHDMTPVT